jgi:thiaminase/transcriptional activator TenA
VLKLTNSIAATLTEADKERVATHFMMTSRFEYLFWDMGYRQQAWEV